MSTDRSACRDVRRDIAFPSLPEGWSAIVPARQPLRGRFAELVPLDPDAHGTGLFAASHGPGTEQLWDYMSVGPFPDSVAFRAWLESVAAADDPLMFTILDLATGTPQGMASFLDIRTQHGGIEIGNIWFGSALQRTRAATEALYLMMREAIDSCHFLRLQWKCNALNAASRRAALRLGFRYEGVLFAHMAVKGRMRDTAYFSILADEWPQISPRIAAWLDDANFDDAGRQRRPLSLMMGPQQGA